MLRSLVGSEMCIRDSCGDVGKVSAIVNLNRDWMPRGERQRLPVGRKIKVPVP